MHWQLIKVVGMRLKKCFSAKVCVCVFLCFFCVVFFCFILSMGNDLEPSSRSDHC